MKQQLIIMELFRYNISIQSLYVSHAYFGWIILDIDMYLREVDIIIYVVIFVAA